MNTAGRLKNYNTQANYIVGAIRAVYDSQSIKTDSDIDAKLKQAAKLLCDAAEMTDERAKAQRA